jgi:SAM-dependent methyltransferase
MVQVFGGVEAMSEHAFTQNWSDYSLRDLKPFLDRIDGKLIRRVLEVGTFEGKSLLHWSKLFPNAFLCAVDAWRNTSEFDALNINVHEAYGRFRKNVVSIEARLAAYIGDSEMLLPIICDEHPSFDFVYIDGSHYADDTLRDALNVAPYVSDGGYIVFDDYRWNKRPAKAENPKLAVDVFPIVSRYPWFRVHNDYTVAYRKGQAVYER